MKKLGNFKKISSEHISSQSIHFSADFILQRRENILFKRKFLARKNFPLADELSITFSLCFHLNGARKDIHNISNDFRCLSICARRRTKKMITSSEPKTTTSSPQRVGQIQLRCHESRVLSQNIKMCVCLRVVRSSIFRILFVPVPKMKTFSFFVAIQRVNNV